MRNYQSAGQCLMVGILLPLLILGLHPTAHDLTAESGSGMATLTQLVHGIALASQPLVLLGLIGLTQRLNWSLTATGAFVAYCFGVVATLTAALMSGFVAPDVIVQLRIADPATVGDYQLLLRYTHVLNQAFAKLSVIAGGLAFVLWAIEFGRTYRFLRLIPVAGIVIGMTLGLGILLGKLVLNVQGILIATGLQAVWLALVAVHLQRINRTPSERPHPDAA